MPRYFFNVHGDEVILDPDGTDWPDPAAARRAAVEDARLLLSEGVLIGEDRGDWSITVVDDVGAPQFDIALATTISKQSLRRR